MARVKELVVMSLTGRKLRQLYNLLGGGTEEIIFVLIMLKYYLSATIFRGGDIQEVGSILVKVD